MIIKFWENSDVTALNYDHKGIHDSIKTSLL